MHLVASSKGKNQSHGDCQGSKCISRCRDILHWGIYVLPSSVPWFPQISLVLIAPLKVHWSDSFTYISIVSSSWVRTLILGRHWAQQSPELHTQNHHSSFAGPTPLKCSYSHQSELCLVRAMQRSLENVMMSFVWLVCVWSSGYPESQGVRLIFNEALLLYSRYFLSPLCVLFTQWVMAEKLPMLIIKPEGIGPLSMAELWASGPLILSSLL